MDLGCSARKTRYGMIVSETNQEKGVEWCQEQLNTSDIDFNDVVFTNEFTVQLEMYMRNISYKEGQPVNYKMRAKHPPEVNTWAGTSSCGATKVVIFTGTLTVTHYVGISEAALLPFFKSTYPDGYRFQQDNDPKHNSRYEKDYSGTNQKIQLS